MIHAEEIGGIVFLFDGGQALQVRTECRLDDVFCFDVERRKQVCVRRERSQNFLAGSGPVAVHVRLRRIGPLRKKQDIPRQIAVRECGGFTRNPACRAALVFEHNKGKRRTQTVCVLHNRTDRIV